MVVWTAMTEAAGGRAISAGHVAAALRLMEERAGSFHAPGQRLERVGTKVVLRSRPPGVRGRWSATNLFSYSLSIPGEVRLPYAGCVVSAEPASVSTSEIRAVVGSGAQRSVALVRGDLCRMPLAVRNRRPGDRFSPAGLGREKKLQDFLMDHKVARDGRDRVPLVVDASGRIVWVAGYAIDRAFEVTDPAQGVLILRLRQLGGSA
jgi:tRNA(Ile)-lysidine synthase